MNITTTDTEVRRGDTSFSKEGIYRAKKIGDGILISGPEVGYLKIMESDTINGESFADLDLLLDYIGENFFFKGEGSTVGVAGITGLESGNLIFGGAGGNEQRVLRPSDLGIPSTDQRVVYSNAGVFHHLLIRSGSPTSGTIVARKAAGEIQVGDATADNDAVTLNQFKGIVNNSLTNAETSATLQAIYSTAVVGTKVRSVTAATEYEKISPTQWAKSTLTIV